MDNASKKIKNESRLWLSDKDTGWLSYTLNNCVCMHMCLCKVNHWPRPAIKI